MIDDQRISDLAETLSRTGVVTSGSDAIRMAQSIIGTEKKVAGDFSRVSERFNKNLATRSFPEPQSKSYQEN